MPLRRFGFIVKGSGYQLALHNTAIESPKFLTVIVGVSTPEEAIGAIKKMAEDGIQLVELCGGFEEHGRNV